MDALSRSTSIYGRCLRNEASTNTDPITYCDGDWEIPYEGERYGYLFSNTRFDYCTPDPTKAPTETPTEAPTTAQPSTTPTKAPSTEPTIDPTFDPTMEPTLIPSDNPTLYPTMYLT